MGFLVPRVLRGEGYKFEGDTLITRAEIRTETRELGGVFVQSDLDAIDAFLTLDAMVSSALALLACVVAAVAAAFMQRSISRPIGELSDVADQVTRDEVQGRRAAKLGDDEVGRIVDSFNGMLDRIHQRETALAKSEAKYRMLSEQASDGILLWTLDQRIQLANPAACDMLGYSESELLGLRMSDIFEPGDVLTQRLALDGLRDGRSVLNDGQCRCKDGLLLRIEAKSKMLEDGRIQSILRDLSERHEMEERLRMAQRMEAVGQLAGGVAHDFNNLLTVICGGCEFMLMDNDLDPEVAEEIREIEAAARRATDLTRQLLAFSRQQVLESTVLDLNQVIPEMERMLQRLIGEDICFKTSLNPELGSVVADPSQIEQVIVNLSVNARDAMPEGGEIQLSTANLDLAVARNSVPPGSYVVLGVRDTGYGMDEATLGRIFEPFFTTKQRGEGTGLGLATVYGIVRQSGGHIAVDSEEGVGTSFTIYLPRVDEQVSPDSVEIRDAGRRTGSESILVVEDETAVRSLIEKVLKSNGYRVLVAKDGAQALAIADDGDTQIDVVITDFVMPGISGLELAERLRAKRPGIRIIFISGYAGDDLSRRGLAVSGDAFLSKPFSNRALTETVRTVLDSR